jgi:phage-related protein
VPPWRIEFYIDARGNDPVSDYIRGLGPAEQAMTLRWLDLLETYGTQLQSPYVRPVEGKLWELRPGPNRFFHFLHTGQRIIVLHAYRKKSRRAP